MLRLGLQVASFSFPGQGPEDIFATTTGIARAAERAGFDSFWLMDHFQQIQPIGPPEEPMLEAYTTLGALAPLTESINLGALVTGVTYRNPALLAKIVTTLDVISGGRALLGIGATWNEAEHRAYGYRFPPTAERFDRLEEALEICRALFDKPEATFRGDHYSIEEAHNVPGPRRGAIPILIGGGGEKRTLRLVARFGDACNLFGDADTLRHKLEVLDRHCAEVGRDPAAIARTHYRAILIAESSSKLQKKIDWLKSTWSIDPDRISDWVTAGTPEEITAWARGLKGAGINGVIVSLPDAHDLDGVELAGTVLREVM